LVNIVNLIGLGAVVIIGILIFTQFQKLGGFLGSLKFPEIKLPEINILGPSLTDTRSLTELGLIGPIQPTPENLIGPSENQGVGLGGAVGDRLREFMNRNEKDEFIGGVGGGLLDFLGLDFADPDVTEAAPSNTLNAGGDISEQKEAQIQNPFGQQFFGGGPSFIGGQVLETPIANLSLSQIIDRFGVTASQAADIRARELDDFGDFDFGTNQGLGIGSIIPSISSFLSSSGAVSDSQFQGLSATEIALRLTGGNISNF